MAILLAVMKNPDIDSDSRTIQSVSADSVLKKSPLNKKVFNIINICGVMTDEVSAGISSRTFRNLSFHGYSLKDLILRKDLLCIPLISWAALTVALQGKHVNRMYLILFIHKSDGEKGPDADFLTV